MPAFTPRNVSKFVVKAIVGQKATDLTRDVIVDHTQYEETDLAVKIPSRLVGWYIAEKVEPFTDRLVDKTADWYSARKSKKNISE